MFVYVQSDKMTVSNITRAIFSISVSQLLVVRSTAIVQRQESKQKKKFSNLQVSRNSSGQQDCLVMRFALVSPYLLTILALDHVIDLIHFEWGLAVHWCWSR